MSILRTSLDVIATGRIWSPHNHKRMIPYLFLKFQREACIRVKALYMWVRRGPQKITEEISHIFNGERGSFLMLNSELLLFGGSTVHVYHTYTPRVEETIVPNLYQILISLRKWFRTNFEYEGTCTRYMLKLQTLY